MTQDLIGFDIAKARISEAAIRKELENLDDIISEFQSAVNESSTWWTGGSQVVLARKANEFSALGRMIDRALTKSAEAQQGQ